MNAPQQAGEAVVSVLGHNEAAASDLQVLPVQVRVWNTARALPQHPVEVDDEIMRNSSNGPLLLSTRILRGCIQSVAIFCSRVGRDQVLSLLLPEPADIWHHPDHA